MSKNRRVAFITALGLAVVGAAWLGGTAFPLQAAPQAASQSDEVKRIQVDRTTQRKLLTRQVRPTYPPDSRRGRIQGTVKLGAIIDTAGRVAKLEVIDGQAELIDSAIEAVKQWQYEPTKVEGKLVEVETQIDVNYRLRG